MSIRPCPYPGCTGPDGQAVLTGDGICETCRYAVDRDLANAPDLYVQLHLALEPSRTPTEKVSGSGGSRSAPPLRLALLNLGKRYRVVLTTWEALVVEAERLSQPSTQVRDSYAVQRAALLLAPRSRSACRLAPDSAVDLALTTREARRLLGLTRRIHRLQAPCPNCGSFGLRREDGAALIRCVACNAGWADELYQRLALVVASEYAWAAEAQIPAGGPS